MPVTVVTPPAAEPITVAEAKAQCRIDHATEDTLIGTYITAARQEAERYTRRALVTQTLRLTLDAFPCGRKVIDVPMPRLQHVTEIIYVDADGAEQTLAEDDYQVDVSSEPGRIAPASGTIWPATDPESLNAVRITYDAGYGLAAAVPEMVKNAIKLIVARMWELRSPVVTGTIVEDMETVQNLLRFERIYNAP